MFLFSAASAAARPKEWIIGVGFSELSVLLESRPPRVFWLPVPHRFDQVVKKIFKTVAQFSLSRVALDPSTFEPEECRNLGRSFRLLVFEFGLCQFGNLEPAVKLKALAGAGRVNLDAHKRATASLRQVGLESKQYGFIHIRLGDYVHFKVRGESPVIPLEWYLWQTKKLLQRIPNLPLVVLSDDIARVRSLLTDTGLQLIFVELGTSESLHVMQNARAGILSASTFSWWGARLASYSSDGPFIAPKYWMGFRTFEWFPSERITSDFLDYSPVSAPENDGADFQGYTGKKREREEE